MQMSSSGADAQIKKNHVARPQPSPLTALMENPPLNAKSRSKQKNHKFLFGCTGSSMIAYANDADELKGDAKTLAESHAKKALRGAFQFRHAVAVLLGPDSNKTPASPTPSESPKPRNGSPITAASSKAIPSAGTTVLVPIGSKNSAMKTNHRNPISPAIRREVTDFSRRTD